MCSREEVHLEIMQSEQRMNDRIDRSHVAMAKTISYSRLGVAYVPSTLGLYEYTYWIASSTPAEPLPISSSGSMLIFE